MSIDRFYFFFLRHIVKITLVFNFHDNIDKCFAESPIISCWGMALKVSTLFLPVTKSNNISILLSSSSHPLRFALFLATSSFQIFYVVVYQSFVFPLVSAQHTLFLLNVSVSFCHFSSLIIPFSMFVS